MSSFMISYDLHSPTSNREVVQKDIESLGTYCRYLTTTYLVQTNYSNDSVQRICTKHLDNNDRMIICEITGSVSGWLEAEQWNWINRNI